MLDIKWIKENPEKFDKLLIKRGLEPISAKVIKLDEERRQLLDLIQKFQHARNKKSKILGNLHNRVNREFDEIRRDVEHINDKIAELDSKLKSNNTLQEILEQLPNLPAEDVPFGTDERMNQLIKTYGVAYQNPKAKEHWELGESLHQMEFAQTAKMSGSRFTTLQGSLAKLERALINFMIDIHSKKFGFTEISPPYLVRPHAMYNVGLLPKFSDDSFETTNEYRLIPTGEVPLVNMVADSIIPIEKLPLRYVACTPCFRSEAGSAGRDTRGMIRLHQFSKVELVSITSKEDSEEEHEYILNAAEEILQRLDLPYRIMLLCSQDMGFQSAKTFDIEVWLPGQNKYREISSCSNCTDFQARRLKARYKDIVSNENKFVHTLNGSALAVGRTIVAILENYQNEDGSITVPKVLVDYMGGIEKIQIEQKY
jgi:seryl-tRNA synthetase